MAPQTARWTAPDPPAKGPDAKFMAEPWGLHPYAYVKQSPTAYWDPDGLAERGQSGAQSIWSVGRAINYWYWAEKESPPQPEDGGCFSMLTKGLSVLYQRSSIQFGVNIKTAMEELQRLGLAQSPTSFTFSDAQGRKAGRTAPLRLRSGSVRETIERQMEGQTGWAFYGLAFVSATHASVLAVYKRDAETFTGYFIDQFDTHKFSNFNWHDLDKGVEKWTASVWKYARSRREQRGASVKELDATATLWRLEQASSEATSQ